MTPKIFPRGTFEWQSKLSRTANRSTHAQPAVINHLKQALFGWNSKWIEKIPSSPKNVRYSSY